MVELTTALEDPPLKAFLRGAYRAALGLHVLATAARRPGEPRVYYAGARAGDIGGPLVKVKRLMRRFPQAVWDYNLVYILSNAAYLPGAAIARLRQRGVSIVHNQDGVFYPAWYSGNWATANTQMSLSYHAAAHVIWQSEFCRRSADRFLGARDGPGEILHNGVDVERYAPAPQSSEISRPFRFLITGKFDHHIFYRLESTIRGLALARRRGLDAVLLCAGWTAPSVREAGARLATDLSVPVQFHGPYSQELGPALYRDADAYVTTKHMDPCPNAVLEALASGLPVLYSNSGGVPELVGPDAGYGVEAPETWDRIFVPSAESIAEGMLAVATHRHRMSLAARERAVTRFGLRTWLDRHEAIFRHSIQAAS